jgi:hypothetical protein
MTWQTDLVTLANQSFEPGTFAPVLSRIGRKSTNYAGANASFLVVLQKVTDGSDEEGWSRDLVKALLWERPTGFAPFRDKYPDLAPPALKETEVNELRVGLEAAFPSYQDLASAIDGKLIGWNLDTMLEHYQGDPPADYSARLIAWYNARGAVRELIELVLKVRSNPVLSERAARVLAVLATREATVGYRPLDPVDVCLINKRVFVDRDILRQALKELSPNPPTPIHAVNGPSRSGKSYTLQLVDYVIAKQPTIERASIDIHDEQHALYRPGDLARGIMYLLNRNDDLKHMPKEADASSAARWAKDLCLWLVGIANTSRKTWVITLDGFYHPDLPTETKDMVRQLLKQATSAGSPLRIVLIDYSDDLVTPDVRKWVQSEQLGTLSDDDLRGFFERLARQEGATVEGPEVIDEIIVDI